MRKGEAYTRKHKPQPARKGSHSKRRRKKLSPQCDEDVNKMIADDKTAECNDDIDPEIESDPDLGEEIEEETIGNEINEGLEEDDVENYESDSENDGNADKGENNPQDEEDSTGIPLETQTDLNTSGSPAAKKSKKRRNSAPSSDEERWLTAIESGKLEDVDDELKKIKDPKLMTARQRALYDRGGDPAEASLVSEELLALPSGYREREKPITAEQIEKAALKTQKRKQKADERREKDKKKTMERLLKKQDSNKRQGGRSKVLKYQQPMIIYRDTGTTTYVQMPPGYEFPLRAQTAREPPKKQLCGMGCGRAKIYNCSKTNVPLCSLECYKKNLATRNKKLSKA